MKSEIIAIYKKEEEIIKITDQLKIFSFGELEKHPHFEFSIMSEMLINIRISEHPEVPHKPHLFKVQ